MEYLIMLLLIGGAAVGAWVDSGTAPTCYDPAYGPLV